MKHTKTVGRVGISAAGLATILSACSEQKPQVNYPTWEVGYAHFVTPNYQGSFKKEGWVGVGVDYNGIVCARKDEKLRFLDTLQRNDFTDQTERIFDGLPCEQQNALEKRAYERGCTKALEVYKRQR